jgi:predicted nucleic acid-binding protein
MPSRPLYLETSALVKLVAREPESEVLHKFLAEHSTLVTSAVAQLELPRALRAAGAGAPLLSRAERVLDRVTQIELDASLLRAAASVEPWSLGLAQTVHLATAGLLGDELAGFVTYDPTLATVARALGFEPIAPRPAG